MGQHSDESKVGFRVKPWCESVSISRATYYVLPVHLRPTAVRIGRIRVITEKPADWLARVGKAV